MKDMGFWILNSECVGEGWGVRREECAYMQGGWFCRVERTHQL